MTARDDAIEAGAKAYWTEMARQLRVNGADNLGMTVPEWDALPADTQGVDRRHMAKVIDAVMPIMRQAIAGEFAQQIEQDAATWHNAEGITAHEHKTFRAAARRVREIGGAS